MRQIRCVILCAAALAGGVAIGANVPAEIRLRASGAGQYLADARGMSLYTYAQDTQPGKSACVAECAKNWPPLLAPASTGVNAGDWSLIERDDGGRQWAWRGRPLYRYTKDSDAGGMLGDGVGNAWRVALDRIALPPGITMRLMYLGRILADARGRSLYWQHNPQAACARECLENWSPLAAPWLAQPQAAWSIATGTDGGKQWAYRGRRLYLFADDLKPGDTNGLADGKDWQVAVLDPSPPPPSWVTLQSSDMGEVFADARGHTLYVLAGQLEKIRQLLCQDDCIRRNWQTVAAAPNTLRIGDWTAVPSPLGAAGLVWAYKGNVLYIHTRDREPGAIGGDKWATGVGGSGGGWVPVLRRRDFDE